MTDILVHRTPILWWVIACVSVTVVSLTTFFVHRHLVGENIKQAEPAIARHDSARRAAEAEMEQAHRLAARKDTLEALLTTIENELKHNPTDSMLVISAANAAYDLEKFDVAEHYYRLFLDKIDPSNLRAKIDLAFVVFSSGRHDEGINILHNVVRSDPKNQTAMFNLAYMYDQDGQPTQAKEWITKCRDANPESELGKQAEAIIQTVGRRQNRQ